MVETGEAREVHHFALLTGYGAGAVNPYLALATLGRMLADGYLSRNLHARESWKRITSRRSAKGVLKVMSKMGISTQQSYRGAQIFEAIGLEQRIRRTSISTWTPSRIEGVGLEAIAEESLRRHEHAYPATEVPQTLDLDVGGQYQWRRKGEAHIFSPDVIAKLQHSTQHQQPRRNFEEFCKLIDDQQRQLLTLARLAGISRHDKPMPLDEVEPANEIVKRFATGAMSYGSISQRSARDAGHRHEPHRRQEQHRRRRRRPGPFHSPTPMAIAAAVPSSKLPAAALASPANIWSAPTSCKSRWPRAQSPAKAASCPGTRSTRKSPACATARRAWG